MLCEPVAPYEEYDPFLWCRLPAAADADAALDDAPLRARRAAPDGAAGAVLGEGPVEADAAAALVAAEAGHGVIPRRRECRCGGSPYEREWDEEECFSPYMLSPRGRAKTCDRATFVKVAGESGDGARALLHVLLAGDGRRGRWAIAPPPLVCAGNL